MVVIIFQSCSVVPNMTKDERAIVKKGPSPYVRVSPFNTALKNFGKILTAYGISSELVIQGKVIDNKTACQNLPLDITDMIETAFNSIGANVRFALFHPEYILLEAKTGSTTIGRKLPELVVDGAITECDEDLDIKSSGVEGKARFGGGDWVTGISGGANREISYSRIALDLHLMEYQTNLLIPHKQTSMAVDVWQVSKGRSFEFMVHGSGLGIDGQRRMAQGKHDSVRGLADLSVLQLLGKYYEIPYWRCLEGSKEDPEVIDMIKWRFNRQTDNDKIIQIQTLLRKHGYDVSPIGKIDHKTKNAIIAYTRKSGGFNKDTFITDLYTRLFITMPVSFSYAATQYENNGFKASKGLVKPDPTSLDLQIAFIYPSGGNTGLRVLEKGAALRSGDDYKLIIIPEEDCYLYLFQMDSAGNLFMLFPLPTFENAGAGTPNPLVGHNTYMLPGQDSAYFLDENRGVERIYLLASKKADKNIEHFRKLLLTNKDPRVRKKVHAMIHEYIQSKEILQNAAKGDTIIFENEEDNNTDQINLTRLSQLSKDQAYVIEFRHE